MLECTCTVPLGMPVEPDEYSQKQGSSQVVGAGDSSGEPASSSSSKEMYSPPLVPETTTCLRNGNEPRFSLTSGANCGSRCSETISARARLSESMYSNSRDVRSVFTGIGTIPALMLPRNAVG